MDPARTAITLPYRLALRLARRRGFALPLILILMALMTLTTQGLWRTAWTREAMAHADADLLQTRQAARALLDEALRDISATEPASRHSPGGVDDLRVFFPNTWDEWGHLERRLHSTSPPLPCAQGICLALPVGARPLQDWQSRLAVGALAGQFTASASGASSSDATGHLHRGTAVYWVEVLPFDTASADRSRAIDRLPGEPPLVYRVTAYAQGRLAGTRVLQQMLWLRSADNTGSTPAAPGERGHVLSWQEWME